MKRTGVLALGCALVIASAGCGSGGGDGWAKAGGSAKATTGAQNAGPPPGGWPQPENGQLTEKMCGLLTDADYAKFGHRRLPSVSEKRSDTGANAVYCLYMTDDELSLTLHPTVQAATLAYNSDLRDHKRRLAGEQRQTILATSVVPGADQSWYDYATLGSDQDKYKEHQLELRRGALLVGLTLSGLRGKTEKDPREVLVGLAQLALQRIPNVGKADTGVTHKVTFAVVGRGVAKTINYNDPTSLKSVKLTNVRLPWRKTVPLASSERPEVVINLSAATTTPGALIGCKVALDGKIVVQQKPGFGLAFCTRNVPAPRT
jgi:hypothetical protein